MVDWITWLSQTQLNPALVYNYGLLFTYNHLTLHDVAYFDHDLLLSMGIEIAKHRLEILKLARANTHKPLFIHGIVKSVSDTTRRGLIRYATKPAPRKKEPEALSFGRSLSRLKVEWKDIETGVERSTQLDYERFKFLKSPRVTADSGLKTVRSGPVGRKKVMGSGPIKYVCGPINEDRPVTAQTPRFSGPWVNKSRTSAAQLDGPEHHSPWAGLFNDLRPT